MKVCDGDLSKNVKKKLLKVKTFEPVSSPDENSDNFGCITEAKDTT